MPIGISGAVGQEETTAAAVQKAHINRTPAFRARRNSRSPVTAPAVFTRNSPMENIAPYVARTSCAGVAGLNIFSRSPYWRGTTKETCAAAQGKTNVAPTRRAFANLGSGRNHLAPNATMVRAAVMVNKYFRVTFQSIRVIWVTVMALTSNARAAAGDVLEPVLPLSAPSRSNQAPHVPVDSEAAGAMKIVT